MNPWTLHQDLKRGQALQISQAWNQHVADRKRVSTTAQDLRQVMETEWHSSLSNAMNETFVTSLTFPNPLVSEIYTHSQNVMKEAQRRGHGVGTAMSLETGWDFRKYMHRKMAYEMIKKEQPFLLVLAFPCGPWSPLTRLNPSLDLPHRRREGRVLLQFALRLARLQKQGNRHYILENPLPSMAWTLPEMEKAILDLEAFEAIFDQCRLGLRDRNNGLPHRKSTRILTSSSEVASLLDGLRCKRDHIHSPVIGGSKITAAAGIYPAGLVRRMLDGIEKQFVKQYRTPQEVLAVEDDDLGDDDGAHDGQMPALWGDSASDEELVEDKKLKVSAGVKMAIKRLHDATGHRSNKRLARALVLAEATEEAVHAAKMHKCDVCDERRPPKARRPASPPTPRDTSDQVHIDVVETYDCLDRKYYVIHVVDWATRFQVARVLPNRSSASIIKFLAEQWLPIFGPPRVLVADQAQ